MMPLSIVRLLTPTVLGVKRSAVPQSMDYVFPREELERVVREAIVDGFKAAWPHTKITSRFINKMTKVVVTRIAERIYA